MRLSPFILAVIVTSIASPLAAQERMGLQPIASHPSLPAVLRPARQAADVGEPRRAAMDALEEGLITGAVVGLATGGVYGAAFAKECGTESDCTLSREYKTMILAIAGGALGSIIGAGTSYLLDTRNPPRHPAAPLSISPDAAGGLGVGVMLRH